MRDQSRPDSVLYFERLTYVSMAMGFCGHFFNWDKTVETFSNNPLLFIFVQIVILGIQFFWIWLVAYQSSNWARWVTLAVQFVFLVVIGVGFTDYVQANSAPAIVMLSLETAFSLIATCFLFTRDATMWFVPQQP